MITQAQAEQALQQAQRNLTVAQTKLSIAEKSLDNLIKELGEHGVTLDNLESAIQALDEQISELIQECSTLNTAAQQKLSQL